MAKERVPTPPSFVDKHTQFLLLFFSQKQTKTQHHPISQQQTKHPSMAQQNKPQQGAGRNLDFQGNLFAGSISGLLSTMITNPFDTLRTRMAASRDATGVTQKTLSSHIKSLFSDGMVNGLGVGLKMNLISSVPSNAIYLSAYKFFSKEVRQSIGEHAVFVPMLSAMCAVMTTNATLSPFFTIRTRVMIEKEATITGIAKDIMAREGPRGFYRGALANTGGRIVEEATFWLLYESAMSYNKSHDGSGGGSGKLSSQSFFFQSAMIIGASSLCKTVGSTISYPYNVVMTHIREVDQATGKHKHNHIGPTVKYIYAKDGVKGFWKGITPHLIRCALSKSTQIYFFEIGAWCYESTSKIVHK